MYMMKLQWKEFNVDLAALDQQLRADHPAYVGNQAHAHLELWFSEEPSQEAKEAIESMWAALDAAHVLAQSYKSANQLMADKEAKKASAKAKLEALGLSADEVKALLG